MAFSSGTFETNEPLLSELLEDIGKGTIQLPDFQRNWIWDDEHIRSLIASVTLSYPIGAVMVLGTGGDGANFLPRPFAGVQIEPQETPDTLVLDGQQRLTSLYLALMSDKPVSTRTTRGQETKRLYYLDMAKCLDPDADREDAILSIPETKVIRSDFGRKIDLDVSTRDREYELGLYPLWMTFNDVESFKWNSGFKEHFKFDPKKTELIDQFLGRIWLPIIKYKVPVIELKKETPKEAVCQVFEKVNTGGVTLSVFELVTASFAADNFRLRDDWAARQDRLSEREVLRALGGTDFLQAVTLLASYKRSRQPGSTGGVSVRRRDVLRLTLDEYKENADSVENGMQRAAELLSRQTVFDRRNLPYGTQLIPLAAVCAHLEKRFDADTVLKKLARWYWCGVLGEMYGGANETRYAMDMQDLVAWIEADADEPRTVRDANFAPMRLLGLSTRNSAAYKGLFALMVRKGSYDFKKAVPIAHTLGFELPVDIHHIFPRFWCRDNFIDNARCNSVINKTPLTSETNRMLGGSAPSQYLVNLTRSEQITEDRLAEVLRTHWIEPELLRCNDFDGFIRDRAIKLLDAIENVMGKPVQGRDSEEVREAFGGSLLSETQRSPHQIPATPTA